MSGCGFTGWMERKGRFSKDIMDPSIVLSLALMERCMPVEAVGVVIIYFIIDH